MLDGAKLQFKVPRYNALKDKCLMTFFYTDK